MLLPYADGDVLALNAASLAGKLLQLANGAVYDEFHNVRVLHDRKLDALEDLIEAANGKPVLVMYNYQHDLTRIQQRFGKGSPENPNGVRELKTASDMRTGTRERFPWPRHSPRHRTRAEPPAGRQHNYLVWPELVARAVRAGQCAAMAAGAEGDGSRPPSGGQGHHGRTGDAGAQG